MTTFHCSAILFDLDGVLVDSTGSVEKHWRIWARARGIDENKVVAIAHGVRAIEVIRAVAPHLDAAEELRLLEAAESGDHAGFAAMPGAIDLVQSVPRGRWGVVTSGSRSLAADRLRSVGVPDPPVMVTADDVTNGKPHPEPYLKAAGRLDVLPSECLVIEDAPAGIRAALAGGMKVVALASTYDASRLTDANVVVKKLAAIRVSSNGSGKLVVQV